MSETPEPAPGKATEDLVAHADAFAAAFVAPAPKRPRVAVLACMDARLDPAAVLGLETGDAHVIRNAGGVASDDALRSLIISQRLLGTEQIVLVHHTDCGMERVDERALRDELYAETGVWPSFPIEAFSDAAADVRRTAERIRANPFVLHTVLRGFVFDVETGRLREVELD